MLLDATQRTAVQRAVDAARRAQVEAAGGHATIEKVEVALSRAGERNGATDERVQALEARIARLHQRLREARRSRDMWRARALSPSRHAAERRLRSVA